MPHDDDERLKLRKLARAAIEIARGEGRGTTELGFWKIVCDRLDRLETGFFPPDETPTKPQGRMTPPLGLDMSETLPPVLQPPDPLPVPVPVALRKASGHFQKVGEALRDAKRTQEISPEEMDAILAERPEPDREAPTPRHPTQPGLGIPKKP